MSGVFLNFYEWQVKKGNFKINFLPYPSYDTKDKFKELRDRNPQWEFYRLNDKIFYWPTAPNLFDSLNGTEEIVNIEDAPRVFNRILEIGIVRFLKTIHGFRVFKNRYSNTWSIISNRELLKRSIPGIQVNRQVEFSPYFFKPGKNMLLGFTLSSGISNSFSWSKSDFEKNGIETNGLKNDGEKIFANKQSIKHFITSRGVEDSYIEELQQIEANSNVFKTIDDFYKWLQQKANSVFLPDDNILIKITKRYLPFEDNKVKFEKIFSPNRYFYSGRPNDQRLPYYNQQVKTYKPYSYELFENVPVKIGVLCPKEFEGITEGFISKLDKSLKEELHIRRVSFDIITVPDTSIGSYKSGVYDERLLSSKLAIIIVSEEQEQLPPDQSPYYFCKAKLIGNGIPTQDIQIETIRSYIHPLVLSNIALNVYAKLGGTAWTVEREEKIKEELVIGIGSTINSEGKYVLGIAQIFHSDGRYLVGDCSPLSTFDNYTENLEAYLFNTLSEIIKSNFNHSQSFRLIFHLYKGASEEYEVRAVVNLMDRFKNLKFDFALLHLGYGHNFRLFYDDGNGTLQKGLYVKLDSSNTLLHFVPESIIPLKISLDKRSTFKDLFYLSKQVFWFSSLSHRSYNPSKRTVTIMYPSLMAAMTDKLQRVPGWDYDRLQMVNDKIWFI